MKSCNKRVHTGARNSAVLVLMVEVNCPMGMWTKVSVPFVEMCGLIFVDVKVI